MSFEYVRVNREGAQPFIARDDEISGFRTFNELDDHFVTNLQLQVNATKSSGSLSYGGGSGTQPIANWTLTSTDSNFDAITGTYTISRDGVYRFIVVLNLVNRNLVALALSATLPAFRLRLNNNQTLVLSRPSFRNSLLFTGYPRSQSITLSTTRPLQAGNTLQVVYDPGSYLVSNGFLDFNTVAPSNFTIYISQ